jgi:hypothetical protein
VHAHATAGRAGRRLLGILPAVAVGALILGSGLGPGTSRASVSANVSRAGAWATTTATITTTVRRDDPRASAAREVDLQETGYLHAVGEPGDTIVEQGHATGTYDCSITVTLTIVAANHVTARFTVEPHGGSVTGAGSGRFVQQGADGYFGGTVAITHGTGDYAHASGANIGVSGVVDRETFALTVHVHGKIDV